MGDPDLATGAIDPLQAAHREGAIADSVEPADDFSTCSRGRWPGRSTRGSSGVLEELHIAGEEEPTPAHHA